MEHGSEEVCWVKHRNSEATAILRLSTMRLDQVLLEDLPYWVALGNDACHRHLIPRCAQTWALGVGMRGKAPTTR